MHEVMAELNKLAFAAAPVFYKLLYISLTGTLAGFLILAVRRLFDRKISPFWKYIMWTVVILALIVPYRPQSEVSLAGNIKHIEDISFRTAYDEAKQELHDSADSFPINESEHTELEARRESVYFKSLIFDVMLPLLWVFGMIAACTVLILSRIYFSKMLRKHIISDNQYGDILEKCKAELKIKRNVRIKVQDYLRTPALTGIVKPVILLPEYVSDMSPKSLKYIIIHELGHLKRGDMLLNCVLLAVRTVHWFNPFIRYLFEVVRDDMELMNDSWVLEKIGESESREYALSLVEVLGLSSDMPLRHRYLCMTDGRKNTERRIRMIKEKSFFKKNKVLISLGCIGVIAALSVFFLTSPAEEKDNDYGEQSILADDIPDEKRELTAQEIEEVNKAFEQLLPVEGKENELEVNPICFFFCSHYDDVREMDMGEFVYYMGRESYLTGEDEQEAEELTQSGFDLPFKSVKSSPVPFGRIPYEKAESCLEKYAGLRLKDMENMGSAIYSDEHQCFYSYSSDFGVGVFCCTSGIINGDEITLFSEATNSYLKMKYNGDRYLIVSHSLGK